MTKFLCGECIHNSDKGGGCLIPKNLGYVDNCNHYLPKDRPIVQTNEEWLRNLSFNELARVLYCMIINGERIRPDLAYIKQWLKEKHGESDTE